MNPQGSNWLYEASIWVLPVVFAITLHEAAHGFVAHRLGDDTAWERGRVTANPLRHIDPVGTILMPALLILAHAPVVFGYAKPVPVDFRRLYNPKRDMVWVALAGPGINIVLALLAGLFLHITPALPETAGNWVSDNLGNAIIINVILAVFNMIPLPPLDGGRVAVGLLPQSLSRPLARLERYGMLILILLLLVLPSLGGQDYNLIARLIAGPADFVYRVILTVTGNG